METRPAPETLETLLLKVTQSAEPRAPEIVPDAVEIEIAGFAPPLELILRRLPN